MKKDCNNQLNRIVEHHMNEENVPRVSVKDLMLDEGVDERAVDIVDGDAQTNHYHILSHRCAKAVPQDCGLGDVTHQ